MTRIAFMIATAATLSLSAALAATPVKQTLPAPAASTAAPAIITKVTPELMLAIVKGAGFTATLDKTGDSPELTLTRKNSDVVIYLNLHDCKTGSCSEADAYVYYSADDLDTAPDDSDMAAWNMENYTQAYIDSEDE